MTADLIRRRDYEPAVASQLHEHPLLGRLLASRGIAHADELELQLKHLPQPGSMRDFNVAVELLVCLLYTSPSPRDQRGSRMPSSA